MLSRISRTAPRLLPSEQGRPRGDRLTWPYVPRQENSKMVVSAFVVQGIQRAHPKPEAKHR